MTDAQSRISLFANSKRSFLQDIEEFRHAPLNPGESDAGGCALPPSSALETIGGGRTRTAKPREPNGRERTANSYGATLGGVLGSFGTVARSRRRHTNPLPDAFQAALFTEAKILALVRHGTPLILNENVVFRVRPRVLVK